MFYEELGPMSRSERLSCELAQGSLDIAQLLYQAAHDRSVLEAEVAIERRRLIANRVDDDEARGHCSGRVTAASQGFCQQLSADTRTMEVPMQRESRQQNRRDRAGAAATDGTRDSFSLN